MADDYPLRDFASVMRLGEYIVIPTAVADKQRASREKARVRRARFDFMRPDKDHGRGKGAHHGPAPFVFWDGEGPQDTGYSLFGNSDGFEICHPYLGTEECLSLIMDAETANPTAIHTSFGFNYDVSMILRELSWRHLSALHAFGRTMWRDWELQHIPHKWFKVKRGEVVATIYDIRSFFAGGYVDALLDFEIGTPDDIALLSAGKAGRAEFMWADIRRIRRYWLHELRMGPLLCESLRGSFANAGYVPRSWHGPGALARMALRRHKIYDAMATTPVDVQIAAQYAFAGGRFELFKAGHVNGKVFNADINSAYPYFATMLPNLARGRWRRTTRYESGRFAVYHISYDSKPNAYRAYPLFRRMPSGEIAWPHRTQGWFWAPEAALVANDPDAKFIEGWIFDEIDETDRPFAFLAEYYAKRKVLKNAGNPAEYTFKLIINSIYGQLAQRAGWDRRRKRAPKSHQLEWAGFITSACRASVYRVARECGDDLISIDTDGVCSLSEMGGIRYGSNLGQWEPAEYDDGIFWQSGIYSLRTGDDWIKAKARGIPKGSYTADELLECLHRGEALKLSKKVFVTYGLAGNGRRREHNQWVMEPHEFAMGGSGKRIHFPKACASECGTMHRLGMPLALYGPYGDATSRRHYLPWLDPPPNNRNVIDDLMLFDANHLDFEDEWVREYNHEGKQDGLSAQRVG